MNHYNNNYMKQTSIAINKAFVGLKPGISEKQSLEVCNLPFFIKSVYLLKGLIFCCSKA